MRSIPLIGFMLAVAVGIPPPGDARCDDVRESHRRGVVGGVHDFTAPDAESGQACGACHVPHIQAVRAAATPPATQPATRPSPEPFRVEDQRKVFLPNRYTPGPASLICLGCHDGTIATSTIGSSHAMLAGVREGFKVPEGFIRRDHPIGVPYPSDRRKYHPRALVENGGVRLPAGRIECVSCHDPHNESGVARLLIKSNRRSALCLTCHMK